MGKSGFILKSFLDALGTFVYAAFVAWLGFNGQTIFEKPSSFLMPLFMLLLFVRSALATGLLVLGKPIVLYLNGLKREAFILLFSTLGWLILFLLIVTVVLLVK